MKSWTTISGYTINQILDKSCNAYLISNRGRYLLIDTGRKTSRKRLFNHLEKLGAARLDALIMTHTHFDHAGNAAQIREKFQTKVIAHKSEARYLKSGNSPLPGGTISVTKFLIEHLGQQVQSRVKYEPCDVDIQVEDSFDLAEFGCNARIIHTPGHTSGSMSVIVDDEIAVAGDTLFGEVPNSVFPPFADDVEQLIASWAKLLETKCDLFLPAHGFPITRKLLEKCYKKRIDKSGA
jgi:hydroxyacylglutathione hydrolase